MNRRHLTLIGLPGSGGITVAQCVRSRVQDGDTVNVISIVAPCVARAYCLDPFGIGIAITDDELPDRRLAEAHETANRLCWLLWEMEIAAAPTISHATLGQAVAFALDHDKSDTVIIALGRRDAPILTSQIQALHVAKDEIVVTRDTFPGPMKQLVARLAESSQDRSGNAAPRRRWHGL